jgi:hypothetical protein
MKHLKRFNESNFFNFRIPYGIKKMFKGESEDKVTLEDIDDLKDLFIEFCDEFNFTSKELDSEMFHRIAGRLVINKVMSNSDLDQLIYTNHIFSDGRDGDYIMFFLNIGGGRSNKELSGIFSLSNNIYDRVLNMGYNCDINLYNISNSMDLFLVFRIGNQLNSVNNIKKHNLSLMANESYSSSDVDDIKELYI